MSAQLRRRSGIIFFGSALLAIGLEVSLPTTTPAADDCVSAPSSSAPPNNHWYYRTDRAQQRKCWYLRADGGPSEQVTVHTAPAAPTAKLPQTAAADGSYSFASFRNFMAQQGGPKLSDRDVEKIYAEFLEWNRRNH
jgi:hypothetical protein